MRDFEAQLIEGLSEEEAKKLIRAVNGINSTVGLPKFGATTSCNGSCLKKFGEENAHV